MLSKGRPFVIPPSDWARHTPAQRTDKALDKELDAKFFTDRNLQQPLSIPVNRLKLVKPGDYVFTPGTVEGEPKPINHPGEAGD